MKISGSKRIPYCCEVQTLAKSYRQMRVSDWNSYADKYCDLAQIWWITYICDISGIDYSQEEVERCKRSDMLEALLKQIAGEFPLVTRIFIEERDLYMANALHTLLRKSTYDKRIAWSRTDGELRVWILQSMVVCGWESLPYSTNLWKYYKYKFFDSIFYSVTMSSQIFAKSVGTFMTIVVKITCVFAMSLKIYSAS